MTDAAAPGRRALLAAAPALLAAGGAVPALLAAGTARAQGADPARPILVRGATVLSMDPAVGDLPRGDILVRDGAIAAVAPSVPAPDGAQVIEAAGRIALPGFVNGHIHLAQTLQRGLSTDHGFGAYFQQIVLRHSNRMTPEDVAAGDLAGALEQIAAGTTTLVDWSRETMSPAHAEAALGALEASGVRAVLLYTVPLAAGAEANARHVAHARELAPRFAAGRVRLGFCLPGPDFAPLEVALADLRRLAEFDLLTAYHTGAPIYAARKPRVIATLADAGLLSARTQIVHANAHEEDEYRIAAEKGVSLCSAPEVELRMGHGQPAAPKAQAAGMRVSLGTDIPSMVGGGMLPQARILLAAELHRRNLEGFARDGRPPQPPPVTARAVLEMLTIGGARSVGLGDVTGSLTPGKRADLLLVRAEAPLTAPSLDPVGTVLFQASTGEIEWVLVDGRVAKADGRLAHPGAEAAFAAARERAAAMAARAAQN